MINFSQFLSETRQAPLYHATTKSAFMSIISFGLLKASPRTFFTRSLTHAKWFGETKGNNFVIFEFDQQKLKSRYKIQPIKFFQNDPDFPEQFAKGRNKPTHMGGYDESEEFTNQTIKRAMSFVTAVHSNDPDVVRNVNLNNKIHKTNITVKSL